ncbi:putative bifunctional diguanylate cyclase/phosphodiesterase [Curvivirga aplysinae]|uniref:putative bifunctional diguanylate cyclase/phosphodiesterase n=1 Tax=Curvivirga aplysinae TaxID=2529852 RepID=UPI0012BC6577|nr:EAL domain-containing protein [Curvivirga aplysinae]MTI10957.1 EAL domain-containing protein [Curvivirga aplysinae]
MKVFDRDAVGRLAAQDELDSEKSLRKDETLRNVDSSSHHIEKANTAFGLSIFSWDTKTNKAYFDGCWKDLLQGHQLNGNDIRSLLDLVHPEDYGVIYLAFSDLTHGRVHKLEREARLDITESGIEKWVLIRAESIRDEHGDPIEINGAILDITSYKTTEQQAAEMIHQDMMTGLPNRQQILTQIEQSQKQSSKQDTPQKMDVAVLDIDRFRLINESLGESAGDEVIRIVGERLRRQLRRDDFLARLGGDQFAFAILSSLQTDDIKISSRLEKIRQVISDPINLSGEVANQDPITLEVNIGLRRSTTSEDISAENLLRDASLALREAKSSNAANFAEFHNELHEKLLSSVRFEKIIRTALTEDWIEVHYQPVIESVSGKPTGFEALVRINHPDEGLMPPNIFIPVAEETGLIRELTRTVISKSLKQLAVWRETVPNMRDMTMAINLSPVQFEDDEIINDLKLGLHETGLMGNDIKIEITESLLIKSMTETVKILDAIKEMGIQICIDDFGTGYSSLSYIRNYSFDTLKIDRSFIEHVTREPRDAELVRSIVQMGQNVGMNIVVEGVEEHDQHDLLKELGCHFVQGFLVAKPLPAEQIGEWLLENNHV